jgi:hypothetical protein
MRDDQGGRNLNALSFDVKEICDVKEIYLIKLDSICRLERGTGVMSPVVASRSIGAGRSDSPICFRIP